MRVKYSSLYIGLILYLCWIVLFYQRLNYPILLDEIDYLRFFRYDSLTAPEIWSNIFFDLADGHPPLLSLGISALYFLTDSILFIRVFLLILNLACFSYFFLWCDRLKQKNWVTAIFAGTLLFSYIHSPLLSQAIGDFLGLSLLLGWLYHRTQGQNARAMLCLLAAVMIKETHALPAIIYLGLMVFKERKELRSAWVEIIPGLVLFLFFLLGKLITGDWYSFILQFNLWDNFKFSKLKIFLRFLIPIAFLILVWKKVSNKKYHFLAITTCIIGIAILLPYIVHYQHRARLLTPLMAPLILAILYSFKEVKKTQVALFLLILASIEFSFRHTDSWHIKRANTFYNFIQELNPSSDTLVSGTWPYMTYTAFPNYGLPKLSSASINRHFFFNEYFLLPYRKEQLRNYKKVIFYLADHSDDRRVLDSFCSEFPECSVYKFKDADQSEHRFFIVGYPVEVLNEKWELSLKRKGPI
jgi:hypothetical protein